MLDNFRKRQAKRADLIRSNRINVEDVRTVCLALGPYRNLSTLTAATLALHPHCQVLNHGGERIFDDKRLDFLLDYTQEKLQAFMRYAIFISARKIRGDVGGSITASHAFDDLYKMAEIYNKYHGGRLVKNSIQCLFWKESLRTSNHIKNNGIDLGKLLSQNNSLRFLLPVRSPLDCAVSNLQKRYLTRFSGLNPASTVEQVLEAVLDEFAWFIRLQQQYPDRFFHFFAHAVTNETFADLAAFLKLDALDSWIEQCFTAFEVRSSYLHPQSLKEFFEKLVNEKFPHYPEFSEKLMQVAGLQERSLIQTTR